MRTSREPMLRAFPHVEIVRPKATQPVRGLILVDDPEIFHTHKYEGRTVPCDGPLLCWFCGKLPEVQRIYLPLYRKANEFQFLDLPVTKWEELLGFQERYDSLLGLDLTARRKRPADNAAIVLHADCKWRTEHNPIKPFPKFHAHLDYILVSNANFARDKMESAKTADGG